MKFILTILGMMMLVACNSEKEIVDEEPFPITFMTLEPGHFHAGLVHKESYEEVDTNVYVFAPQGKELNAHLDLINRYNTRSEDPTDWKVETYTGDDYISKMFTEKPGNVMVVAGNNQRKTEYILQAIENDIHVYSDKPMAIIPEDYELLIEAMNKADEKNLLLYDIMTERFEITTILQKELSKYEEVFGQLIDGSVENPAVTKESVHHFFKEVSGSPLVRPAWFFDTDQEGAGIVDVSTHLVDLILWSFFEGEEIQVQDAEVLEARQWATQLNKEQFKQVTKEDTYPNYLQKDLKDEVLNVNCNGAFTFKMKDVVGKVSVIWNFQAPEGAKDTHYSIMKGTKSDLEIIQNETTSYKPSLFIRPNNGGLEAEIAQFLDQVKAGLNEKYPGLEFAKVDKGWEVIIPEKYHIGHEAHFAQVTKKYIDYMNQGSIPQWEKDFLRVKYFLTTDAYAKSIP